jgi:hypothetical protein
MRGVHSWVKNNLKKNWNGSIRLISKMSWNLINRRHLSKFWQKNNHELFSGNWVIEINNFVPTSTLFQKNFLDYHFLATFRKYNKENCLLIILDFSSDSSSSYLKELTKRKSSSLTCGNAEPELHHFGGASRNEMRLRRLWLTVLRTRIRSDPDLFSRIRTSETGSGSWSS